MSKRRYIFTVTNAQELLAYAPNAMTANYNVMAHLVDAGMTLPGVTVTTVEAAVERQNADAATSGEPLEGRTIVPLPESMEGKPESMKKARL